jgi:hypothetical protein
VYISITCNISTLLADVLAAQGVLPRANLQYTDKKLGSRFSASHTFVSTLVVLREAGLIQNPFGLVPPYDPKVEFSSNSCVSNIACIQLLFMRAGVSGMVPAQLRHPFEAQLTAPACDKACYHVPPNSNSGNV